MRRKATHVYSDFNPDTRPALVLTDAALLEIDSDHAPVLTLTAEAQSILDKESRAQRLKRLMHELISSGDDVLAGGDDFMVALDNAQAKWHDYSTTHDAEARWAFQDAAIDLFFLLDTVDRVPEA
jgi:F0F1-type ATP synthase epsilon subunit